MTNEPRELATAQVAETDAFILHSISLAYEKAKLAGIREQSVAMPKAAISVM